MLKSLDVVFCIDVTGSMFPHLENVRYNLEKIRSSIIASLKESNILFGSVLYGDHNRQQEQYIQITELGSKEDILVVRNSQGILTHGDDTPEAVADGIHYAVNMNWRRGSKRVVILVGDALPHGYGIGYRERRVNDDSYPNGCPCGLDPIVEAKRGKDEGITLHAIGVVDDFQVRDSFTKIAQATGGRYFELGDNGSLVNYVIDAIGQEMKKALEEIKVFKALREKNVGQLALPQKDIERATADLKKRGIL